MRRIVALALALGILVGGTPFVNLEAAPSGGGRSMWLAVARECPRESPDIGVLLAAMAMVESGTNDRAVGSSGERGRYQITAMVWRQHEARKPHRAAHRAIEAEVVARKHIRWLHANGVPRTARDTAAAWNCGLARWRTGRLPPGTVDYAERVARLCEAKNGARE